MQHVNKQPQGGSLSAPLMTNTAQDSPRKRGRPATTLTIVYEGNILPPAAFIHSTGTGVCNMASAVIYARSSKDRSDVSVDSQVRELKEEIERCGDTFRSML
jgi:hypothetical protein